MILSKVDSGLGRKFEDLLARCRVHDFFIYPGELFFIILNEAHSKRKDFHVFIRGSKYHPEHRRDRCVLQPIQVRISCELGVHIES